VFSPDKPTRPHTFPQRARIVLSLVHIVGAKGIAAWRLHALLRVGDLGARRLAPLRVER
jgi:hypothetical protein